jgi:quercetin dioxygenase-like cupin family protein
MGKITFVNAVDCVLDEVSVNPREETKTGPRPEWQAERAYYLPVADERLQLFEIRLKPHTDVHPHAHSEDEIIVVTAGEIHVGRRVLGPGAAVYVEQETLYGFRAGPDGCTFLNFRPGTKAGYIGKDELMARRASARTDGSARVVTIADPGH